MSEEQEKYNYYRYDPSVAAASVFAALFGLSSLFHCFQLFRTRTWYFIPFMIGGLFELVGYISRVISSAQTPDWTLTPYIMQSLLILLAPALFAASIYMILGRVIRITDGEASSIIRSTWLTKIFVSGDILSFLTQASGGGILADTKDPDKAKMGENIVLAGLGIQILFFGFFSISAGIFHYRIRAFPTTASSTLAVPWERQLYTIYGASALIMIRSLFRVAEYVTGNEGALMSTEVYLYIFDSVLMILAMVLFNISHPSKVVSKKGSGQRVHSLDMSDGYALQEQPDYSLGHR